MGGTGICFAGFGGQGVILAGMIVGRAASIYDGKFATLTQSFGPEARGSACSAHLLVSPEPILYPYVTRPDILVAMSQEAYRRFAPTLKPGGMLLHEEELVQLGEATCDAQAFGIPATRFAEELGRRLVLNVVMVGFTTAVTRVVSPEAVRHAIRDSVPPGTETLNLAAFEKGLLHGQSKRCAPHAA
jgi:2-oxoglutarate ferredoxin oxidoreductase subunit gamma